ncbi:Uncharacterized membrane protein HdeD, DUF308 family [Rhodococcus triatomae]|uniref:Uncharacterized membrane protein HdeD, DUF308 family n=1 Tax=Rhodococcus triatomae TaxID=300028 RepID=A0A1G7Z5J6_9NOCA|nr:DUF308 domain-containing protein [Rhodococcus triatomae]SDH03897.1 Uncharacterized membrane protein HdeD, DUF308 family [Rhodococcus triatomae]
MVTQSSSLAKQVWWIALIRGIFAIIFGIIALAWPQITVLALVVVFGVYAIIDGVVAVARAVQHRKIDSGWGWWAALGVVSVVAGIVALVWPGITAVVLLYLIAFYAIFFGILGAVGSFKLKDIPGSGWGWLLFASLLAVALGIVLLVANPAAGIIGLTWVLGWYAILFGVMVVIAAFQIRSWVDSAND